MPEFSYIALACQKLKVDPDSILAFHEYDDNIAIVTAKGQKFIFAFQDLEEFFQNSKPKAESKPQKSSTSDLNAAKDNKPPKTTQKAKSVKK
jgi:hypothetical protein